MAINELDDIDIASVHIYTEFWAHLHRVSPGCSRLSPIPTCFPSCMHAIQLHSIEKGLHLAIVEAHGRLQILGLCKSSRQRRACWSPTIQDSRPWLLLLLIRSAYHTFVC